MRSIFKVLLLGTVSILGNWWSLASVLWNHPDSRRKSWQNHLEVRTKCSVISNGWKTIEKSNAHRFVIRPAQVIRQSSSKHSLELLRCHSRSSPSRMLIFSSITIFTSAFPMIVYEQYLSTLLEQIKKIDRLRPTESSRYIPRNENHSLPLTLFCFLLDVLYFERWKSDDWVQLWPRHDITSERINNLPIDCLSADVQSFDQSYERESQVNRIMMLCIQRSRRRRLSDEFC